MDVITPAAAAGRAVGDGAALQALFRDRLGFDTTTLIPSSDSTVARVLAELKALAAQTVDGDTLVCTFACHGHSEARRGEWLQMNDGPLAEQDVAKVTSVLHDRDVKVILLVDACESEGFGTIEKVVGVKVSGWLRRIAKWFRVTLLQRPGAADALAGGASADAKWALYVLAAAKKTEFAFSDCGTAKTIRGCFSLAVETVISAGLPTPISVGDLSARVQTWIRPRHDDQHPVFTYVGKASPTATLP